MGPVYLETTFGGYQWFLTGEILLPKGKFGKV